mmetsp:Transcript_20973/g.18307  ORF Transcript_20973/g.18307 Transcript_20973/m.18307 type:complete len:238 (-) Transcript_20973:801-1514(-)
MTFLQEKSLNMNISLNNRRTFQKSLEKFIDSVLLEPQLISDICNKAVDEKYVDYIKDLNDKLEYIKENNIDQYATVKELEPELTKLKNKACQRVRTFIIHQLELLKKPKTNIQMIQENVLIKYNVFLEFLKNNYIQVFIELLNLYFELMGKLLYHNFKYYNNEMNKLCVDIYTKTDVLLSENPNILRTQINTKAEGIQSDNRSIYSSMGRENVLNNMEEPPIITHVAATKNQRFLLE